MKHFNYYNNGQTFLRFRRELVNRVHDLCNNGTLNCVDIPEQWGLADFRTWKDTAMITVICCIPAALKKGKVDLEKDGSFKIYYDPCEKGSRDRSGLNGFYRDYNSDRYIYSSVKELEENIKRAIALAEMEA